MAKSWINHIIIVRVPHDLDAEEIEEIGHAAQEWVNEQYTDDLEDDDEEREGDHHSPDILPGM